MAAWVMLALMFVNLAYGPWLKSKNYAELMEMAADMAQAASADDSTLVRLWSLICEDTDATEDAMELGRPGRVQFVAKLLGVKAIRLKGPKAAPSKFFSIQKA